MLRNSLEEESPFYGQIEQRRIFYGWYIVLAHMVVHFYMALVFYYGMGVYLNPIIRELGWTRAQFSLAAGLQRIEGSILSPVIGFIVDRKGSRQVVLLGVTLMGLGLILLSRVETLFMFYAAYLVVATGMSSTIGIPFSTAIAKWFRRKRGRAMGLLFAGGTFSGLFLPLIAFGVTEWGWRPVMLLGGVGMIIIGIPAAITLRDSPEPYGYAPDGEPQPKKGEFTDPDHPSGVSLKSALKTRAFWLLTLIFGLLSLGNSAMFLHQIPHFENIGFSTAQATTTVTAFTLFSGIGRVGTGWLMDHVDMRLVIVCLVILSVAAFGILLNVSDYWHSVVFAFLFGVSFGGAIPSRPILTSTYYGTQAFGTITGIMQSLAVIGGVGAPVLMGWAFDVTGTYDQAIIILALLTAIAIPITLALPKPQLLSRSLS